MQQKVNNGEDKILLTVSEIYHRLEQANYTQEQIREIFEIFHFSGSHTFPQLEKFLRPGALVGRTINAPIDGWDDPSTEGGIKNSLVEEVSQCIKACISKHISDEQLKKLINAGIIKRESFCIGTRNKRRDADPFIDGEVLVATINDRRVALLFSSRNPLNHAMIDFIIYPDIIEEYCKEVIENIKGP